MSVDHWMVFGTFAEQRFFVYPTVDTYTGVVINGNMVAYAPEGLAAFLLEKTKDIRYIIDPLTHAFQHDPSTIIDSEGNIKKSVKNLADEYGDLIKDKLGEDPLLPEDLNEGKTLKDFVQKCMDFQRDTLSKRMIESDANKYLEKSVNDLKPYALIAPYFFMTERTINAWLPKMIKSVKIAIELKKEREKIFSEIAIGKGVLVNDKIIQNIVDEFSGIELDGFIIWVDDLDEHQAGSTELKGLLKLARGLRKENTKEVINLHGSYFSIITAEKLNSFSGVAHGPEFGEHRPILPVGGGVPLAKYYIPLLHNRVNYKKAVKYFKKKKWLEDTETFHLNVCNCRECKETLNGDISKFALFGKDKRSEKNPSKFYPIRETKEHCLRHYLQRKKTEFEFVSSSDKMILDDLNKGVEEYKELIGLEGVDYLGEWKDLLIKEGLAETE